MKALACLGMAGALDEAERVVDHRRAAGGEVVAQRGAALGLPEQVGELPDGDEPFAAVELLDHERRVLDVLLGLGVEAAEPVRSPVRDCRSPAPSGRGSCRRACAWCRSPADRGSGSSPSTWDRAGRPSRAAPPPRFTGLGVVDQHRRRAVGGEVEVARAPARSPEWRRPTPDGRARAGPRRHRGRRSAAGRRTRRRPAGLAASERTRS